MAQSTSRGEAATVARPPDIGGRIFLGFQSRRLVLEMDMGCEPNLSGFCANEELRSVLSGIQILVSASASPSLMIQNKEKADIFRAPLSGGLESEVLRYGRCLTQRSPRTQRSEAEEAHELFLRKPLHD